MTHSEIEAFLAVCRNKTVTAAAQSLHIEQSSLSARLKALETSLGGMLFHRRRGSREMTLTAAGQAFYQLAVQYEELTGRMRLVCRQPPRSLCVSSFNTFGCYLLPGACDRFLQCCPDVELELKDMDLEASLPRLPAGEVDLIFTVAEGVQHGLSCTPLFSEPMYLVSSGSLPQPASREMLSERSEAYISWSLKYDDWHRRVFGADHRPKYRVSMTEQLPRLLLEAGCWAIVPHTVLNALTDIPGICRHETTFPLPRRTISWIAGDNPAQQELIRIFLHCLRLSLSARPELTVF